MTKTIGHFAARRRFLRTAGLSAAALWVAGCGFRPVYGTGAAGYDVMDELEATKIEIIPNREGQILHNYLLDNFNPRGRPVRPRHLLTTSVSLGGGGVGTQLDRTTVRTQLVVNASAELTVDGKTREFTSKAVSGYSTSESIYASTIARQGAIERAMETIAEDLRVQIATFFEKRRLTGG